MPTPRRFIPDTLKLWADTEGRKIAVVEVTWRTICGLYLLAPTRRNTNLFVGSNIPKEIGWHGTSGWIVLGNTV